jgi:hypothetical protein
VLATHPTCHLTLKAKLYTGQRSRFLCRSHLQFFVNTERLSERDFLTNSSVHDKTKSRGAPAALHTGRGSIPSISPESKGAPAALHAGSDSCVSTPDLTATKRFNSEIHTPGDSFTSCHKLGENRGARRQLYAPDRVPSRLDYSSEAHFSGLVRRAALLKPMLRASKP